MNTAADKAIATTYTFLMLFFLYKMGATIRHIIRKSNKNITIASKSQKTMEKTMSLKKHNYIPEWLEEIMSDSDRAICYHRRAQFRQEDQDGNRLPNYQQWIESPRGSIWIDSKARAILGYGEPLKETDFPILEEEVEIRNPSGTRAVSLSYLGEGRDGDYNPDDDEDIPSLRVDVGLLTNGEVDDNFSTCTCIDARISKDRAEDIVQMMMHYVEENDESLKRLADAFSWLTKEWDGEGFQNYEQPPSLKAEKEKNRLLAANRLCESLRMVKLPSSL